MCICKPKLLFSSENILYSPKIVTNPSVSIHIYFKLVVYYNFESNFIFTKSTLLNIYIIYIFKTYFINYIYLM